MSLEVSPGVWVTVLRIGFLNCMVGWGKIYNRGSLRHAILFIIAYVVYTTHRLHLKFIGGFCGMHVLKQPEHRTLHFQKPIVFPITPEFIPELFQRAYARQKSPTKNVFNEHHTQLFQRTATSATSTPSSRLLRCFCHVCRMHSFDRCSCILSFLEGREGLNKVLNLLIIRPC